MTNNSINLEALQIKAKERTVKTQNIEYDLETIVKRLDKGSIKIDPDYQRRHRWSEQTSSKLIESLLLNIPIPTIFISQDIDVDDETVEEKSRFTVIDGQQRLSAIHRFMKNELELDGLESLSEINGCTLKDLPPFLTRRLEERTIKCQRIDSTVDAQIKFDIFERLNTGSIKLESQELRNATTRGPFNDIIKELALLPDFRNMLQIDLDDPDSSVKVQKMEDVELVLRFFALKDGRYKDLKKGFREFLTSQLDIFNRYSPNKIKKMENEFEVYMKFVHETLGSYAFAKHRVKAGKSKKKMSSFNAAVYDAVAIGVSEVFNTKEIKTNSEKIVKKLENYITLFEDEDFFSAVSGSVNDAAKVKLRIEKMIEFIRR